MLRPVVGRVIDKAKNAFRRVSALIVRLATPERRDDFDQGDIAVRRRRNKRNLILGGMTLFLSLTVGVLFLQDPNMDAPIFNNLTVALMLNFNVILLIALVLLVFRKLVKLYFERRWRIAGSRFQTKLVISFLAMTLIPSALMFAVASELLSDTVDKWLNARVEQTLQQSLQVAESLYSESERKAVSNSSYLAGIIESYGITFNDPPHALTKLLQQKLGEYDVDLIQVYNAELALVTEATSSEAKATFDLRDKPDMRAKILLGQTVSDVEDQRGKNWVVSISPITGDPARAQVKGAVVVVKKVTRRLIEKVHSITKAFEDYKQLTIKKEIIKASYQVTLALVALVIMFSAIWVGLYLARGITVPLMKLSEATEAVARGDLSVRINTQVKDDETAQLIDNFNRMTHDLESSKEQLELANRDLLESNTELHHWGQYIEAVLDNVTGGVISIDKSGAVTTMNGYAARMFGIAHEDVRGQNYRKLFDATMLSPIRQMIREMTEAGRDTLEKEVEINLNGVRRTLKASMSVLKDHKNEYIGIVFVFDDLTDFIAAQRAIAWREMARVVAHEIKNPLTPIKLNAQRIRKKFQQNAEDFPRVFDDATNIIIQEVDALKKLVDKFTAAAKMMEAKPSDARLSEVKLLELRPEPSMLHDIIFEVVKLYRHTRQSITLSTELDPSIQLVKIDAEQMKRVFINMVENAIDAMNGEGSITIRTRHLRDEQKVIIEVVDTGHGVSETEKQKIFTPYFSTKPHGAGLGLAIATRVIEDHGGSIRVFDNEPQGTVFYIELPME